MRSRPWPSSDRGPRRCLTDVSGGTAIEYGLLAALIAVALISVLGSVSGAINTKLEKAAQTLQSGR